MRKTIQWVSWSAAIGFCLLACIPARGDQLADVGRQVLDKWQSAVVTAQISVKTTYSPEGHASETSEGKGEFTAVVIDPSGLVVMPLSETSPGTLASEMESQGQSPSNISSEITDLKIMWSDGTQVPYKIVARDNDFDLAFLKPVRKLEKAVDAMDMSKPSRPLVLDQIILLDRLGPVASRTVAAFSSRVEAIVQKPRTFYIVGPVPLGTPVFTLDGETVGITVIRAVAGNPRPTAILLPASDILEAAKQVPAD